MNLSAHILDTQGQVITFMLSDRDTDKEIVRSYHKHDLPQLRQVLSASQKYFLYLEYGTRAAEEYQIRKKEMQASLSKIVEQLENTIS